MILGLACCLVKAGTCICAAITAFTLSVSFPVRRTGGTYVVQRFLFQSGDPGPLPLLRATL